MPPPGDLPNRGSNRISGMSYMGMWVLYHCAAWEAPLHTSVMVKLSADLSTVPGTLGPTPDLWKAFHSLNGFC